MNEQTIRMRRRLLLKGAGALAVAGVHGSVLAQRRDSTVTGEGQTVRATTAVELLRAPKYALVIGNAGYKYSPLRNPVNDAKAMAAVLGATGFNVTLRTDAGRDTMTDALRAYSMQLAKTKAVGLFYFAGHGVQLAWRNYLIPVDAEIATVEEVRDQAIDLNRVVEAIRVAGNPMNMLILDACRDDPFGARARVDQRGLSQLDAPPGTFLAYATAPGNTAADGEGTNGLYTESLLREMKVPEARVEDVFKRVRLAVRMRSRGQQVPWESTSLEEDFWFIPPKAIKQRADAQAEREFKEELALWEKAQTATQAPPLQEYLSRYPSGRFSEIAQLRLDQVLSSQGEKKIEAVVSPQNPYSKGTARANTAFKLGDRYTYRTVNTLTQIEGKPFTRRVTGITDNEVIYNNGGVVTDLLGNELKIGNQHRMANQIVPLEFAVGKRWTTRFRFTDPWSDSTVDLELRIVTRETITVPAGTFDAFRIEARGWRKGTWNTAFASGAYASNILAISWNLTRWYVPDKVRWPIASLWDTRFSGNYPSFTQREELTSFVQS